MLLLLFAQALAADLGGDEAAARRELDARAAAYRQSRERLRADLLLAIDGPQEAEAIAVLREAAPEELAKAAPDYEPDLRALLADMGALKRIAALAISEQRRRDDEDERDVELLLLA